MSIENRKELRNSKNDVPGKFILDYTISNFCDVWDTAPSGYSTHYSAALSPKTMLHWADDRSLKIKELITNPYSDYKDCLPFLFYTGMSGVAYASYLAACLELCNVKIAQAYIRKEHEMSHAFDKGPEIVNSFEFRRSLLLAPGTKIKVLLIFVDDFISTGETFYKSINGLLTNKEWLFANQYSDYIDLRGLLICTGHLSSNVKFNKLFFSREETFDLFKVAREKNVY